MIEKSSDIEQLARTVSDNGGIYFVQHFPGYLHLIGEQMQEVPLLD